MRKTYIVNIKNINKAWQRLEKRTKYDIRKCDKKVYETNDIKYFNDLHKITRPDRIIDLDYIVNLYQSFLPDCRLYSTGTATVMVGWKEGIGYYLMAARDKTQKNDKSPSKVLWKAFKSLSERGVESIDLCGANVDSIAKFKRGFGGKLVNYKSEKICRGQI